MEIRIKLSDFNALLRSPSGWRPPPPRCPFETLNFHFRRFSSEVSALACCLLEALLFLFLPLRLSHTFFTRFQLQTHYNIMFLWNNRNRKWSYDCKSLKSTFSACEIGISVLQMSPNPRGQPAYGFK